MKCIYWQYYIVQRSCCVVSLTVGKNIASYEIHINYIGNIILCVGAVGWYHLPAVKYCTLYICFLIWNQSIPKFRYLLAIQMQKERNSGGKISMLISIHISSVSMGAICFAYNKLNIIIIKLVAIVWSISIILLKYQYC